MGICLCIGNISIKSMYGSMCWLILTFLIAPCIIYFSNIWYERKLLNIEVGGMRWKSSVSMKKCMQLIAICLRCIALSLTLQLLLPLLPLLSIELGCQECSTYDMNFCRNCECNSINFNDEDDDKDDVDDDIISPVSSMLFSLLSRMWMDSTQPIMHRLGPDSTVAASIILL